jgi:dATP pyrophosphohydrolase
MHSMARVPLQILVIPYRRNRGGYEYAVFRRRDDAHWQWLAGGAEEGETAAQAAARELHEEAGVAKDTPLLALDSCATVPRCHFSAHVRWDPRIYVVPEKCFAVDVADAELQASHEHSEFRWLDYATAMKLLRWDSNKTALWELSERLHCAARLQRK